MPVVLFFGLVSLPVQSAKNHYTTQLSANTVAGFYYMHGTRIDIRSTYPGGGIIVTDTLHISFTLNIKPVENKQDTIQFFGLEGVNAGEYSFLPADCSILHSEDVCAYARLENSDFEIDFLRPGGSYWGSGSLENGVLTLETEYHYRGRGIQYSLHGVKIK
ncbi:MAG: hypothetical protein EA359_01655 [Balneolaceae bacterium]|nr:MAG: hypothetical protein EA359_01655 [Balneolaceae bacterium]